MTSDKRMSRRSVLRFAGIACLPALAGCAETGTNENETSVPTKPQSTSTPQSKTSATGETMTTQATENTDELQNETYSTPQKPTNNTITKLTEYRYITENSTEWINKSVTFEEISYVQSYSEEYQMFRIFFEEVNEGRPVLLKTESGFEQNETITVQGDVEKIESIQDIDVIFITNISI